MSDNVIKEVLRRLPYGFYSVTSKFGDEENAMVLNWMTQVSFEPRLIAIAVQKTSFSYQLIEKGKVFALNVFNIEDADAIKPITKGRKKNPDKMMNLDYTPGPETACPILDDAAAFLECRVRTIQDIGGDHNIVIGEIVGAGEKKQGSVDDTLSLPKLGWSYAG
jgi:flavin reductase (DIM6/NTAB) family NADH-FMN oxidoreductase RutF